MTIKSCFSMVEEAKQKIKSINFKNAMKLHNEGETIFIDLRDIRELEKEGKVENAIHIPRGMLEFWIDPSSQYFKEGKLDLEKEMVLVCAAGARSALAAKALQDMGFEKVSHIDGGFGAMNQIKFIVI